MRIRCACLPLAFVLSMLVGCGPRIVYDDTASESPEGRACAAQCSNTQVYCRQSAESGYRSCQASFQNALVS